MSLNETLEAINNGTILLMDIAQAKSEIENEIAAYEEIIQDHETEFHVREEYKSKRATLKRILHKI